MGARVSLWFFLSNDRVGFRHVSLRVSLSLLGVQFSIRNQLVIATYFPIMTFTPCSDQLSDITSNYTHTKLYYILTENRYYNYHLLLTSNHPTCESIERFSLKLSQNSTNMFFVQKAQSKLIRTSKWNIHSIITYESLRPILHRCQCHWEQEVIMVLTPYLVFLHMHQSLDIACFFSYFDVAGKRIEVYLLSLPLILHTYLFLSTTSHKRPHILNLMLTLTYYRCVEVKSLLSTTFFLVNLKGCRVSGSLEKINK